MSRPCPRPSNRWWRGLARGLAIWPALSLGVLAAPQATPPAAPQGTPPAAPATPQTPPAPPAPAAAAPTPGPQAVTFATPAGALLLAIKPDKLADFEALMKMLGEALATSPDETLKQVATGWRLYKASEPAPGGSNALYVLVLDPAVGGADYSWQKILTTIHAAFPDKAQEIFEKGTSVHAGPMNKLSLTPVR